MAITGETVRDWGQSLTSLLQLSRSAGATAEAGRPGLMVNKSVCLKVNRSEEVSRPDDLQVQLDNSIYIHDNRTADRWEKNEAADSGDDPKGSFNEDNCVVNVSWSTDFVVFIVVKVLLYEALYILKYKFIIMSYDFITIHKDVIPL